MVMEHTNCPQCLAELNLAITLGFIHHFRLLQNGSLQFPETQKVYDLNDVSLTVTSCPSCSVSRYLIITTDGIKGMAVEFWEAWSEK